MQQLVSRTTTLIGVCMYIIITAITYIMKVLGGTFGNMDNLIVLIGWVIATIIGMKASHKVEDKTKAMYIVLLFGGTGVLMSNTASDVFGILIDPTLQVEMAIGVGLSCLYPMLLLPIAVRIILHYNNNLSS